MELGGKSPVVVFENSDIDSVIEGIVDAIWFNQGQVIFIHIKKPFLFDIILQINYFLTKILFYIQVCCAGSKLLVQESIYEKVIKKLVERLSHFRVGCGQDKAVDMGAIVDESQRKTIDQYVEEARAEGAEVRLAI